MQRSPETPHQARNYAATNDKTVHDCPDPDQCATPATWQDHCSCYRAIVTIQGNRTLIEQAFDPIIDLVVEAYRAANPKFTPERGRFISKATRVALFSWVARAGEMRHTSLAGYILQRTTEALDARHSNTIAPVLRLPVHRCRRKRCDAPFHPGELPCDVYGLAAEAHRLESMLITYYQPRIKEAQSKARKRIVLFDYERSELPSCANEAFLVLVRSYNTTTAAPFQGYLRRFMHHRIEDVVSRGKAMARPLRDYELKVIRYMDENPRVTDRRQAARELGTTPERIRELENVRSIHESWSLDSIIAGPQALDHSSSGGFENDLTPINTATLETPDGDNDDPLRDALSAVLQALTPEQISTVQQHFGLLEDSTATSAATSVDRGTRRLLNDIKKRAHAELTSSIQDQETPAVPARDVRARIERALSALSLSQHARLHAEGGIRAWAEKHQFPPAEAFRVSDVLLRERRSVRGAS